VADHQFTIVNKSSFPALIDSGIIVCANSDPLPTEIDPGGSSTVNWTDDSCKPSFVAFKVSLNGRARECDGWVGMVYRYLHPYWLNGLFYASTLSLDGNGKVTWGDGWAPAGILSPICPYGACAIGPMSEMVWNGSDNTNYPLMHTDGYGWSIVID
jgi:hypothetical protein